MRGDLIAAIGWLIVVLLGIVAARASSIRSERPSRPVHLVIFAAMGLTLLAGGARRELWPFANWSLMAGRAGAEMRLRVLVCVDASNSAFMVDHRAWSPLTEEELIAWINGPFARLRPEEQASAAAALATRAESGRQRARSGRPPEAHPSRLGTLAASSHLLHPKRWTSPESTPDTPCVALRLIERRWDVDSFAAGRATIVESTMWQHAVAP